jgi:uncharacterized metal-binding protein
VKNAEKVVILDGCGIKCGTRMLDGVVENFNPQIICTDTIAEFNKGLFGISEMTSDEIDLVSRNAAEKILKKL